MTLNKRYLRNIKENLSFYIASSVLTVVALLLFYLFYIAGSGTKNTEMNFLKNIILKMPHLQHIWKFPMKRIPI